MRLAPYALIATLALAGVTAAVGIAPPPPLAGPAPWKLARATGPHGDTLEATRATVTTARIEGCTERTVVPAVQLADGYVLVPAEAIAARRIQLVGWNGTRGSATVVTGRVQLGRPSTGAVLLTLAGAGSPPVLGATLPSQGAAQWSLRATPGQAPEPAPARIIGSVSGRVRGLATRYAMVEPANLPPVTALTDVTGTLTALVVDRDADGRPLAVTPALAVRVPRVPPATCAG